MEITYIRSSSFNSFEDCEHKFFQEYILNIPSSAGKKALIGTCVHKVLEILALCKKNNHFNDKYSDTNYLKKIVWKYLGEPGGLVQLDYKHYNNCIDDVLNSNLNPLKLNIIKAEQTFHIPIKRKEFEYNYFDLIKKEYNRGFVALKGTIDLITEDDANTIHIIDWKTGKRKDWQTGDEKDFNYLMSKDVQLRMYDLAAYYLYPQYKYRLLTIVFIKDGGPFTVSFSDEDREETLKILAKHYNAVKNNFLPSRIKETKPKQAWKCEKTCYFGKTKTESGHCICDKIHNYMLENGIEKTVETIAKIRNKKRS